MKNVNKNKFAIGRYVFINSVASQHRGGFGRIVGYTRNDRMVYVHFDGEPKKSKFYPESLDLISL